MNASLILLILGLAGAVIMLLTAWARRVRDGDLGTVSHHWIAEQRLGQGQNSQR